MTIPRLTAIFLVAAALFVAGCGSKTADRAPSTGAPQPPDEVRLGYFANLTHAQAVLGVSSKEFEQAVAPVKFTTKVFNAGPSLMQALNAGQIDVAYVGPGPILSTWSASHGEGVRVIAGACADGVVIVARKDSGITKLTDLAGRKLATPELGNTQDIAAKHYVQFELHQGDANSVVPIRNSEQAGQMERGNIDAAWVPEPWGALLMAQTGATLVGQEREIWPNQTFGLTYVVTSPDFLAQHPDVVEKLLTVHHRWTQKLRKTPDAVRPQLADALAALTGKKLSDAILAEGLSRTKFTDEATDETFKTNARWSFDLKFIRAVPSLDGLIDPTVIRKVEQANP